MLRPSPNHGTQRLPNDDDDDCDGRAVVEIPNDLFVCTILCCVMLVLPGSRLSVLEPVARTATIARAVQWVAVAA